MNAEKFAKLLESLNLCDEGMAWAKGKSLKEAFQTTDRPDWMILMFVKMADKPGWPSHTSVLLTIVDCVNLFIDQEKSEEEKQLLRFSIAINMITAAYILDNTEAYAAAMKPLMHYRKEACDAIRNHLWIPHEE